MFGLFGNKKQKAKTVSRIGMTRTAAFNDLVKELKQGNGPRFVFYFFEGSREVIKQLLEKENLPVHETAGHSNEIFLLNARKQNLNALSLTTVSKIYCIDHFPLRSVFENYANGISEANPSLTINIYGGLDEPIFNVFGGERIKELMVKMGMKEDEMIEHSMVSKAIENAQEKIEKKVITESPAHNAEEWFRRNLPGNL